MSSNPDESPDLISLADLFKVANSSPQPYRVHVQVESRTKRFTSQGSEFIEMNLVDSQEHLLWRIFDNNPCYHDAALWQIDMRHPLFIELTAEWIDTGKFGIEPKFPKWRYLEDEERSSLLRGSKENAERQKRDYADLENFVGSLSDPRLKNVAKLFLDRYGERLQRTAGAREFHHARRGGLVEHTAQMMRSASAICGVYPQLNRDLLLVGVLFHDCGKLWENCYAEHHFHMPYHVAGELLGHISLGLELVNKLWRETLELPEAAEWSTFTPSNDQARLHLLHLIASHHGELQYGSPVLPKTPEAMALHYVDNLDAKLEMMQKAYDTSEPLAPGIFKRRFPLQSHLVSPLSTHDEPPAPTA